MIKTCAAVLTLGAAVALAAPACAYADTDIDNGSRNYGAAQSGNNFTHILTTNSAADHSVNVNTLNGLSTTAALAGARLLYHID